MSKISSMLIHFSGYSLYLHAPTEICLSPEDTAISRSGGCATGPGGLIRITLFFIVMSSEDTFHGIPFPSHLWPWGSASLCKILAPKLASLPNTTPALFIGDFHIHIDVRDPSNILTS